MAKDTRKRKIKSAYDAWWFLWNHPKLCVPVRDKEPKESADALEKRGFLIHRDVGGTCWRVWRHTQYRAVERSLEIHYAKVDIRGKTSSIPEQNTFTECWLELLVPEYGYACPVEWGPPFDETSLNSCHDVLLDCGGKTFDEALIKLAKLVLRHYGDHPYGIGSKKGDYRGECGQPCGDCLSIGSLMKKINKITSDSPEGLLPSP